MVVVGQIRLTQLVRHWQMRFFIFYTLYSVLFYFILSQRAAPVSFLPLPLLFPLLFSLLTVHIRYISFCKGLFLSKIS